MATEPRRLVIFDVDGTLVDSQVAILASMEHAFRRAGRPVPAREQTLGIVGLSLPEAMATLVPDADRAEHLRMAEDYKTGHTAHREDGDEVAHAPLYPGAKEAILRLDQAGYALTAATGKSRRGLDRMLAAHGLDGLFRGTQTADDAPSKPHPQMVLNCLAAHGAVPEQAVMIGDTAFDMAMGRAAGVRTLGVTWGYHPVARIRDAGAERMADGFAELETHVAELVGRP